jgi:hypothetical protein
MSVNKKQFLLMKNSKWKKTHVMSALIRGASLCKNVTEFTEGTITEKIDKEIPTCMDCRELLSTLSLFDSNLPEATALILLTYARYAHVQEKYHNVKIF